MKLLSMFVVLAAAAVLPAASNAAAPPDPSRNIGDYVLFGLTSINWKGGADENGEIVGNVGVNKFGSPGLSVGSPGPGGFNLLGTSYAAADKAGMNGSGTSVYDLYTNDLNGTLNPATQIRNSGATLPLAPDPADPEGDQIIADASLPATPVCTPGTNNEEINGTNTTLLPGTYGEVRVKNGGTLRLLAGVYQVSRLQATDSNVTVYTQAGTEIYVDKDVNIGNGNSVGDETSASQPADLARWYLCANGIGNDRAFQVGQNGVFHGQIWGPTAKIGTSRNVRLYGRFWANEIHSDFRATASYRAPESVSGHKFVDVNGNGQNDGEAPLAGITFYVDVNDNGILDPGEPSAVTDAAGNFSIGPLNLVGSYNVREVGVPGYSCTFPGMCSYSVALGTSGTNHGDLVFGNKPDCTTNPNLPNCTPPPPCVPTTGQNAQCQPIVTPTCVPKAGEDKDCRPIADTSKVSGLGSGCVKTSRVRVSGTNIAKVVFKIDGKTVKTVRKAPFSYLLKTKNYKVGAHKFTATTTFKSGKTKTQRLTFQHCKTKPQIKFTG